MPPMCQWAEEGVFHINYQSKSVNKERKEKEERKQLINKRLSDQLFFFPSLFGGLFFPVANLCFIPCLSYFIFKYNL